MLELASTWGRVQSRKAADANPLPFFTFAVGSIRFEEAMASVAAEALHSPDASEFACSYRSNPLSVALRFGLLSATDLASPQV